MTAPAVTWGGLHVGDVVAGADGREWAVYSLGGVQRWVAGGPVVDFTLQRPDGVKVATTQKLTDPAPLVRTSDDREQMFAGFQAITDSGMTAEIIEETTMTVDPFANSDPAPPAGLQRREAPRGKWGWYKLPDPNRPGETEIYPRVSTIAETLGDQFGLTAWKMRKVAKGVALRKDLIAKAVALNVDTDKQAFTEIVDSAMEAAESGAGSNYGTAAHKFCERLDLGESIESMRVPDDCVAVVRAYAEVLRRKDLTVLTEYSERTVVHHGRGYAGTIDRIVRAKDGQLYILDLKTGKEVLDYGLKFGVQQALYANAQAMCTLDFTGYEPMPPVDQTKALICHVPFADPSAAEVYDINITRGAVAAGMAFGVRDIRGEAKDRWMWVHSPATGADAVQLRIGRATSVDELMTAVNDAKRMGVFVPDLEAYALARYDLIRALDAADRAALAALWEELAPIGRWTDDVSAAATRRAAELTAA